MKKQRLKMKLDQSEMAERLGVSPFFYSHVENGRRKIPIKRVKDWAKAFDVNISVVYEAIRSFWLKER